MTYVDDLTVTTDNPVLRDETFAAINAKVTLEDRGIIKSFLGMHFEYNAEERYWSITQETYILDLCASMGLLPENCKAARTPEVKRDWTKENSEAVDDAERRRVADFGVRNALGGIQWVLTCTRPDTMHAVKNPSQFVTDPGDAVVHGLKRIGRYLLGNAKEGLRLYGNEGEVEMCLASDADDAGSSDHRRSLLCWVNWIGPPLTNTTSARRAVFQWTNKWSIAVASGSMESEIYAIHAATKSSTPIRGLLHEIGLANGAPSRLAVDSASSRTVLQGEYSEKISTGVKHIDRRVLGVRQQFSAGIYTLDWVPSADNISDIGAAYKSHVEFERLRTMLVGYEFPRSSLPYLTDTQEPRPRAPAHSVSSPPAPVGGVAE